MFINPNKLKAQIKKAYTAGIKIGHKENGIMIVANHWMLWFQDVTCPNSIKAVITEFLGFVPEEDGMYFVSKEYPMAQSEVDDNISFRNFISMVESTDTKVLINKPLALYHLYQASDTHSIVSVNESLVDMVSEKLVDFDAGEQLPDAHLVTIDGNLIWLNSTCKLLIMKCELRSDLIRKLEEFDFEEE